MPEKFHLRLFTYLALARNAALHFAAHCMKESAVTLRACNFLPPDAIWAAEYFNHGPGMKKNRNI